MTDPAPSPPAGQPPVPVRPMPRLGVGLVWSDVLAKIEADQAERQTDFKEPAEDLNPGGDDSRKLTSRPTTLRPGWPRIYSSAPIALDPEPGELLAMADDLNAHGGLDETFVAGLLQAVAEGSETGGNPSGGPPYTHRYVPPSEDEPPAPSYTYTAPSRRARWLRALDRVRRPR